MLRIKIMLVIFAFLPSISLSSDYLLGAGDEIKISVFQEPDLSFDKILIPESGVISYPFIGSLTVSGRTVESLEIEINDALVGDYLISPKVLVSIKKYRGVFVDGQVNLPGQYPYEPGLTVRKAISIGGGFNERADYDSILLIKENKKERSAMKVNLDAKLNPGDVIIVNESFF